MKLSRRKMLQWSGASLFAPLMLRARADTLAPPRVVLVVEGNSFYPSTVMSEATRTALGKPAWTAGETFFSSALSQSAPRVIENSQLGTASALTPLAALQHKAAVVLGLSSVVTGGGHSTGRGALSCSRGGTGASIDTVLGARLKGESPFDVVRVGAETGDARLSYATCTLGPGRPAPIMLSPEDVYQRLFSLISMGSANPAVARNGRLLDFARAETQAALATFPGSSTERAKLEGYLQAVEAMEARNARLTTMRDRVLPHVPAPPAAQTDLFARLTAHFDLVGAALLGGLTNVAVIVSGPGGGLENRYTSVFNELIASGETPAWSTEELGMNRHTLQHAVGVQRNRVAINAVTRKHVELIAGLAARLDAVPEGDGTVLDHTVIVFMSDNGEAHHSAALEWPVLLVGGGALGLRTDGRTVVYPGHGRGGPLGAGHRQVSNLFNTLGHATGDSSLNAFGYESNRRVAEGPLSELLVT